MKIKVPEYVLKHDLTDQELVFCSFMGYLGRRGAKNVRFYMYSDDIKHILGHVKMQARLPKKTAVEYSAHGGESGGELTSIKKVFRIGMVSYHTWSVEFQAPALAWNQNGSIKYDEVEINDLDAIKIYYYIVGRISGNDIMEEGEPVLSDKTTNKSTVLAPFFKYNFMI